MYEKIPKVIMYSRQGRYPHPIGERYPLPRGLRLIIIIIIHPFYLTHPFYLSNLIEPKPLMGKREVGKNYTVVHVHSAL